MAYLDRMGREGVRELVSDGEVATPEQLAERRARLDERRRQNAPVLRPVPNESDISNEGELRDALRQAIAERDAADEAHRHADSALVRGNEAAGNARREADSATAEVERIGADLASRYAAWVASGGEGAEPSSREAGPAAAKQAALEARAVAIERAAGSLASTEGAARAARATAIMRVQQAVHRVAMRDAEVMARRVEALRAEADALAAGIGQIGLHFGPQAMAGAVHHTATARLAGGMVMAPRVVGLESAASRQMREAWGEYIAALTHDADARLIPPDPPEALQSDMVRPVPAPLAL
ncbi:hypothetical protein [Methylobacterium sp. J-067]|uniref:hypothetical protein n=1 Tax=Methylobacterium sp. J-067 TaxID=2836648 RepID=UPI001FB91094|nr:hypothetical protein [Methylobacterium sp. J-067]MCJ2023539.1 hypothetical protein [Methylobacterium sp. J-067]